MSDNAQKTQGPLSGLKALHEDEDGLEALQVVMIVAIAAVALLLIKLYWPKIKQFFTGKVDKTIEDEGWEVE